MKTKVAKLVEINKMEIETEEVPKLEDGYLLVKMMAVGICGSDLHFFLDGGLGSFKEKLPMEMGHEPSGIISDINSVKSFSDGDRVAIEPGKPCLYCKFCKAGKHNLCDNGTFMGAAGSPGAFREYMVLHESQLIKLNDKISYEQGALLEPLGIAYHAISQINFRFYSSIAIFGAGPIGLSLINIAKASGSNQIIVVDKLQHRLDAAMEIGATHCYLDSNDIVSNIKDNHKENISIAFDAAGKQKSVDNCFDVVCKGGIVSLVGIPTCDYLSYNPHKARIKELSIFNVRRSNQTLEQCHELFPEMSLDIVTHKYRLDNIQEAFDTAAHYKDDVLKAMILFD